MWETWVWSWLWKISWSRAWRPSPAFLPRESLWTEEPGRLQPLGLQRLGLDWVTNHIKKKISLKDYCPNNSEFKKKHLMWLKQCNVERKFVPSPPWEPRTPFSSLRAPDSLSTYLKIYSLSIRWLLSVIHQSYGTKKWLPKLSNTLLEGDFRFGFEWSWSEDTLKDP